MQQVALCTISCTLQEKGVAYRAAAAVKLSLDVTIEDCQIEVSRGHNRTVGTQQQVPEVLSCHPQYTDQQSYSKNRCRKAMKAKMHNKPSRNQQTAVRQKSTSQQMQHLQ